MVEGAGMCGASLGKELRIQGSRSVKGSLLAIEKLFSASPKGFLRSHVC